MPTEEFFLTNTLTYADAFTVLEQQNLNEMQVNTLLYGLLAETLGETKRVFNYGDTFDANKPACTASFQRSFMHIDWIDGESVVQAEENTIEEGFNSRFHKIEDDLDALAADIVKSFGCLGELRGELATRLTEIRTAINEINTDIYNMKQEDDGPGYWTGPYYPPGNYPGTIWEPPVDGPGWPGWGGGRPGWGGGRPGLGQPGWTDPPMVDDWRKRPWLTYPWNDQELGFEGMIGESFKGPMFEGAAVMRMSNDPTRATVAGMPAKRLDVQTFNGQPHEVWSTNMGLVLTPAAEGVTADVQMDRSWTNKRTEAVGTVNAWVSENRETFGAAFGRNGLTVKEINEKFGDQRLEGGAKVGDMLASLPSGTKIGRPGQLVTLLAERAASAVKREGLETETLVANVGFQQNDTETQELGLDSFKAMPVDARKALIDNGVKTMGELQKSDPKEVAAILTRNNLVATEGDAARWVGEAMVVSQLGNMRVGR